MLLLLLILLLLLLLVPDQCVCSGVPQIKYSSLIGVIAGRLVGRKNMPGFSWKQGQKPEQVNRGAVRLLGQDAFSDNHTE